MWPDNLRRAVCSSQLRGAHRNPLRLRWLLRLQVTAAFPAALTAAALAQSLALTNAAAITANTAATAPFTAITTPTELLSTMRMGRQDPFKLRTLLAEADLRAARALRHAARPL